MFTGGAAGSLRLRALCECARERGRDSVWRGGRCCEDVGWVTAALLVLNVKSRRFFYPFDWLWCCFADSRTGQCVHCIEVYKYEVRKHSQHCNLFFLLLFFDLSSNICEAISSVLKFKLQLISPQTQECKRRSYIRRLGCWNQPVFVFQSCARPQYGKWISCVTTDSDWMVRKYRWHFKDNFYNYFKSYFTDKRCKCIMKSSIL